MHASLSLGRLAGVEVGVNWSWLIILGLISASLGFAIFPETNPGYGGGVYAAMAVAAAVLFFVSLLLHELGHAVVARREGMEIEGIVLWLFGGVAQFRGLFPSAGAELRIALAGPAVSLVIGVTLLGLALLLPLPGFLDGSVMWLGRINLILLAFNMLPALPLDGGRVFRALVWQRTGDFTRATSIAGGVGRAFGQMMIGFGVLMVLLLGALGGLWFALLGWFLMAAAQAEIRFATIGAALRSMSVGDAMASDPVTVPAGQTLADFGEGTFTRSARRLPGRRWRCSRRPPGIPRPDPDQPGELGRGDDRPAHAPVGQRAGDGPGRRSRHGGNGAVARRPGPGAGGRGRTACGAALDDRRVEADRAAKSRPRGRVRVSQPIAASVRRTASPCGVVSIRPNARSNFDESLTNGSSHW